MMSTEKNRMSTASQSPLRPLSGGALWPPPKKHYDDYDDGVFNWAGSTLAVPHFGPKDGVHLSGLENSSIATTDELSKEAEDVLGFHVELLGSWSSPDIT